MFVLIHEEVFISAQEGLSNVKGCCKIAHIFAVVKIVVSWAVHKWHHSGEGPRELVATVPLRANECLVAEPEQHDEHVGLYDSEGNGGRQLN